MCWIASHKSKSLFHSSIWLHETNSWNNHNCAIRMLDHFNQIVIREIQYPWTLLSTLLSCYQGLVTDYCLSAIEGVPDNGSSIASYHPGRFMCVPLVKQSLHEIPIKPSFVQYFLDDCMFIKTVPLILSSHFSQDWMIGRFWYAL